MALIMNCIDCLTQALTGLLRHELDVPFDILKEEAGSGRESKASAYSNSRSASNMDLSENG